MGASNPVDSATHSHPIGEFNFGHGADGDNQEYQLYEGLDNYNMVGNQRNIGDNQPHGRH